MEIIQVLYRIYKNYENKINLEIIQVLYGMYTRPTKSLGQSPKHNSKITLSRQSVIVERQIIARWIRHDESNELLFVLLRPIESETP